MACLESACQISKSRPTLILCSSRALSHVSPTYLSTALSKRLKAKRIQIFDRSLVRCTSALQSSDEVRLQVFTAKSCDFLEGNTAEVDLVVVAPNIDGSKGSGTLPTDEVPSFLWDDSANNRSWYPTWSQDSRVTCYKDDGRIAVTMNCVRVRQTLRG